MSSCGYEPMMKRDISELLPLCYLWAFEKKQDTQRGFPFILVTTAGIKYPIFEWMRKKDDKHKKSCRKN